MRSLALPVLYALAVVLPSMVQSQILPDSSKPKVYHVKIDASDLASSDTFSGSVLVNITVSYSIPFMLVHSKNLTINESSVVIKKKHFTQPRWDVQKYSGLNFSEALLNITFQSPLAGGEYSFYAEFQGYYQNEMAGFAKVPYNFNNQQKHLGVTAFHPTNARKVFPCFDDPRYRSQFNLDIIVQRPFIAMSNVRPTFVQNVTGTSRMFSFRNYPSIPVQDLSWAVVDQTSYPLQEDNSTSVVIHTRTPYLYINQTHWANMVASSLLQVTGNYTGVPFDQGSSKFELLVLPEFFSGISEGYGFLSFSEEAVLVEPNNSSKKYTQQVTLGLARAIVRQWFGDIVSVDSWQSMWIMSGLNEYLQYVLAAKLPEVKDYELEAQSALELTQKGLQWDSLDAHPLSIKSDDEATLVSTVTDDLTKYKGGALMRMLNDIYGSDAFNYGLNTFISASFAETIANPTNPDLLWNVLYDVASERQVDLAQKSLADIMDQWVSKPGYPVLSISANSTHFKVSQSNNSLWWVPVTYLLPTSTNVSRAWLEPGSEFAIEKSSANWILLNLNQTGFYRVNYTSELWKLLSAQLGSDLTRLPRLSRAQLIDDAFAMDPKMALELTGYLRAETDYYPWTTALRHYKTIMYSLAGYPSYPFLQNYLLQLMNGVIAEIGFSPKPQDTYIDKIKRAMVLESACEFGHQACIQKAVINLKTWMANTFYDADLSPALLCAAIGNSSSEVWYNVLAMYGHSAYPSVHLELLKSLTCTLDKGLLYELLNNITTTKNPTMNNKDKYIILNTMSSKPFGARTLLDWLVDRLRAQSNSSEEISTVTPTTTLSSTASPNVSTIINNTSTNQSTTTELPKAANQSSGTRLTADASVPMEALPESDVKTIIHMILPMLTTMEAGTKLDSFSALGNKTGLSKETLDTIKSATHQIYMQANNVLMLNGKLITWLETEVTSTTATGGSTKPFSPTTSPPQTTSKPAGGSANMPSGTGATIFTCILLLCLHLYH